MVAFTKPEFSFESSDYLLADKWIGRVNRLGKETVGIPLFAILLPLSGRLRGTNH